MQCPSPLSHLMYCTFFLGLLNVIKHCTLHRDSIGCLQRGSLVHRLRNTHITSFIGNPLFAFRGTFGFPVKGIPIETKGHCTLHRGFIGCLQRLPFSPIAAKSGTEYADPDPDPASGDVRLYEPVFRQPAIPTSGTELTPPPPTRQPNLGVH